MQFCWLVEEFTSAYLFQLAFENILLSILKKIATLHVITNFTGRDIASKLYNAYVVHKEGAILIAFFFNLAGKFSFIPLSFSKAAYLHYFLIK